MVYKTQRTFTGNGSQTIFNFAMDYLRKSFMTLRIDGVLKEYGVDYLITGQEMTILNAPPAGAIVYIKRSTTTGRLVSWTDSSVLFAKDLTLFETQQLHLAEEEVDRATVNEEFQQGQLDRCIRIPTGSTTVSTELPSPEPLKSFRWNAEGTALEVTLDPATILQATTEARDAAKEAQEDAQEALEEAKALALQDFTGTMKVADIITKRPLVDVRAFYLSPQIAPTGVSTPLSTRFESIAEAQAVYPHAESLEDEIDWCAIQKAMDYAVENYLVCYIPAGLYLINRSLQIKRPSIGSRIRAYITGDASSPVATYASSGTIIKTTTSGITAMSTPVLTAPNNSLDYWVQEVFASNISFIGTKTYTSTFNEADQSCIGLNTSFAMYVHLHNINSNGFGRGILHENCSEVYHTGLTVVTNNYIGLEARRTSNTDCQVWLNNLQANFNQQRDIYANKTRTLWIANGECVSAGTNTERILIEGTSGDSSFYFGNFNAENHTNGLPLILAKDGFIGILAIKNGCFQSFVNKSVSPYQNNPLIRVTNCNFNTIKVTDSSFDRGFGAGSVYGRNLNSIIVIDVQKGITDTMSCGEIICENNSPSWYNTAITDYQKPSILQNVHLPKEFVNVLGDDALITPTVSYSRHNVAGNPKQLTTNPYDSSGLELSWSSTSDSNYFIINPYLPLKTRELVVTIICDDRLNTIIPRIYTLLGVGTEGSGWNACTTKAEKYITNGITYQKYIFNIQVQSFVSLETGITQIGIANLYGEATATSGLIMVAVYANRKDTIRKNWNKLTPASVTPTAGHYQQGERVENSNPIGTAYSGWVCTISGSPGTWKGYGLIQT